MKSLLLPWCHQREKRNTHRLIMSSRSVSLVVWGSSTTQSVMHIQAAQEREELQRKGDDYDNKIRKAEKEIR